MNLRISGLWPEGAEGGGPGRVGPRAPKRFLAEVRLLVGFPGTQGYSISRPNVPGPLTPLYQAEILQRVLGPGTCAHI